MLPIPMTPDARAIHGPAVRPRARKLGQGPGWSRIDPPFGMGQISTHRSCRLAAPVRIPAPSLSP